MPKAKDTSGVDLNYIIITYILGLYGGLVSGLIIAIDTQNPSSAELWGVGAGLLVIGVILFIVIYRLLGKANMRKS